LTFNATFLSLERLKAEGRLVERKPYRLSVPSKRHLYVTPEIAELMDGKGKNVGFPQPQAYFVTDAYMAGYTMFVSFTIETDPRRVGPELERLEGLDEAWVMCFRKPRPGWRLLGRFFAPAHFVALAAYDRHAIGNREKYEAAALSMVEDWKQLFGTLEPCRSDKPEDYITGLVRDVSKD
jgi:hypothetical protein